MEFEPTHAFFKFCHSGFFFMLGIFCFPLWSNGLSIMTEINARQAALKSHIRKIEGLSENTF